MNPNQILIKLFSFGLNIPDSDVDCLRRIAEDKINSGWETPDIIRYLQLTEHYSPEMSEDWALEQMSKIAAKYKK